MNRKPSRVTARMLALLLLLPACGCAYVGDRALDFLDSYRISVGAGSTVGVRACNLGLVDTGLMIGIKPNAAALGWRYGKPLFFNQKDGTFDADQAEIIKTTSVRTYDYAHASYQCATASAALLPGIFTWTDASPTGYAWNVPEEEDVFSDMNWLWSAETFKNNRYAEIHAFDVELDIGLVVYTESGFSPGEFVDFLLGFLTIDIAKDDGRLGGGDSGGDE